MISYLFTFVRDFSSQFLCVKETKEENYQVESDHYRSLGATTNSFQSTCCIPATSNDDEDVAVGTSFI